MKYTSVITIQHSDGQTVTIACECKDARLTAHVANSIKELYRPAAIMRKDCQGDREAWDFLRDFFHLPPRHSRK